MARNFFDGVRVTKRVLAGCARDQQTASFSDASFVGRFFLPLRLIRARNSVRLGSAEWTVARWMIPVRPRGRERRASWSFASMVTAAVNNLLLAEGNFPSHSRVVFRAAEVDGNP